MSELQEMTMTELLEELKSVQVERSNLQGEGVWPSTPSYLERSTRPGSFLYRFFVKENGRLLSPTGKADLYVPKRQPSRAQEMHETYARTKRYFELGKREDELQHQIEKKRKQADQRELLAELDALQQMKRDIEQRIAEIQASL